jgi:hypothetical protein
MLQPQVPEHLFDAPTRHPYNNHDEISKQVDEIFMTPKDLAVLSDAPVAFDLTPHQVIEEEYSRMSKSALPHHKLSAHVCHIGCLLYPKLFCRECRVVFYIIDTTLQTGDQRCTTIR